MSARAIVNMPTSARRGDVVEVRALLQHPMETGYRVSGEGAVVPRNIVRRMEAHFEGELVFAADLFPAIAANPFVSFHLRAMASGTLTLTWQGDKGFAHRESVTLGVT